MKEDARQNSGKCIVCNFDLAELSEFPLSVFMKAKNQELAKLMLTFSLIYNDFKDYMWFRQLFKDYEEEIDTTKKTNKAGQLNGMQEHCSRMLIAHLLELLETIREKRKFFDCAEFTTILSHMDKIDKNLSQEWWTLVSLAEGKDSDDPFYKVLIKVRNNGTYHYRQVDSIYQGLHAYMEREGETGYVSVGETMEKTRFYYGDAAIQCYRIKTTDEFGDTFRTTFTDYTEKINRVLRFIIEVYLRRILGVKI